MYVPVVIVGAGQAGLAMSHHLIAAGIDHIILERGEVANSWRTERWDSLRLLTPNWMTRLPGDGFDSDDPDGYMTGAQVVAFLDRYRQRFCAPVRTRSTVRSMRRSGRGFTVATDDQQWQCDSVVVAAGASSEPRVPAPAADLPDRIRQITALDYRRPSQLDDGGDVLVVGASASGLQIADELQRSGRTVTLAVGEHIRLPRTYRGRDIYWWMDVIGQLDERYDEVDDIDRARRHASVQLVGSDDRSTLDLNSVASLGVGLVGRLARINGTTAQFSGALANLVANADLKQNRLLDRIDEFAEKHDLAAVIDAPDRPARTRLGAIATELDLARFSSVIWATGYRPTFGWLDDAAFDQRRRVIHDGGVGRLPGMFFLGLPFMRRRRSNLIGGVGRDAADLMGPLRAHLEVLARGHPG